MRSYILGKGKSGNRFIKTCQRSLERKPMFFSFFFFFFVCVYYFYFSCKRKNVSHLISPFLKTGFRLERVMFSQRGKKLEGEIQKGNKFIVLLCLPSENVEHSILCFLNALGIYVSLPQTKIHVLKHPSLP